MSCITCVERLPLQGVIVVHILNELPKMENQDDFIPTKGSLLKGIVSTIQYHSFNSHKSKNLNKNSQTQFTLDSSTRDEFNIKQAKREVIKFGVSGLDNQKKEEYKTQLAIKLGAKPPKNKYVNYVTLQQEKKKKARVSLKPALQHLGKVTLQKLNIKRRNDYTGKHKVKKGSIIEDYGKVNRKPK